jgi:hypothetical protein
MLRVAEAPEDVRDAVGELEIVEEQLLRPGEEAVEHLRSVSAVMRTSSRNASSGSVPDWIDHVSMAQPIVL